MLDPYRQAHADREVGVPAATDLTYADLQRFPDDRLRREIIDGRLFVTPAPGQRHQWVVAVLVAELYAYTKRHGGLVVPAPYDVRFTDRDVVEPDVLFVRAEHLDRITERYATAPPDLVVEVSSASTRSRDVGIKRELYARRGVPEYWFVDIDAERVLVHRLGDGGYGEPETVDRGEQLVATAAPGFALPAHVLFDPPVS
jgi:Uma2 family endonuclease